LFSHSSLVLFAGLSITASFAIAYLRGHRAGRRSGAILVLFGDEHELPPETREAVATAREILMDLPIADQDSCLGTLQVALEQMHFSPGEAVDLTRTYRARLDSETKAPRRPPNAPSSIHRPHGRERRVGSNDRARGSRRTSGTRAGPDDDPDPESPGDPDALKLWESPWGRVSPNLYRFLLGGRP
jgi:hypothetical protein